ncbi:MAG: hypothetical protein FWF18_05370 [Dehalococcoidia bacterium]|nr:hypothetical protein [Dehalococcoidia bacterium]
MSKAAKELLVVFLLGAGVLTLLWGLMYQDNTSFIPSRPMLVHRWMWSAIWSGAGLIVVGVAVQIFLKPAKSK